MYCSQSTLVRGQNAPQLLPLALRMSRYTWNCGSVITVDQGGATRLDVAVALEEALVVLEIAEVRLPALPPSADTSTGAGPTTRRRDSVKSMMFTATPCAATRTGAPSTTNSTCPFYVHELSTYCAQANCGWLLGDEDVAPVEVAVLKLKHVLGHSHCMAHLRHGASDLPQLTRENNALLCTCCQLANAKCSRSNPPSAKTKTAKSCAREMTVAGRCAHLVGGEVVGPIVLAVVVWIQRPSIPCLQHCRCGTSQTPPHCIIVPGSAPRTTASARTAMKLDVCHPPAHCIERERTSHGRQAAPIAGR